jgi:hypothetical protein
LTHKAGKSLFILMLGLCAVPSCAGKRTIRFSSTEKGTANLVSLEDPNGPGENLGEFPVGMDAEKLEGKAVRLESVGKGPQYWFTSFDKSTELSIKVKFLTPPSTKSIEGNRNLPFRILMKAYQALSSNNFQLARELSTKLSEIEPTLSAPHIVIGIAFLQEGKTNEARAALMTARALDPEDAEVALLLKRVQ